MSLSFLMKELYNQISRHHSVVLLDQTFVHCPIFLTAGRKNQPGPYFSSSVVDRPLRPTKDRRLGKLLNYQQPNLMQIHLLATISKNSNYFAINYVYYLVIIFWKFI
jgi:hypothetical protein